jgi:hypothetical protein
MFLDVEGGSGWVDIVAYYQLIIGKITNKGCGYCWLDMKILNKREAVIAP